MSGIVDAIEPVKYLSEMLMSNARARVANAHFDDSYLTLVDGYRHLSSCRRVLERIGEQVSQRPSEQDGIDIRQRVSETCDLYRPLLGFGLTKFDDPLHLPAHVEESRFDASFGAFSPGKEKQALDHA